MGMQQIMLAERISAVVGDPLYTEIMLDSPSFYWRHKELSGAVMTNEVGTAGAYISGPILNQPAIYTGGPVCVRTSGSSFGQSTVALPAANSISIVCVTKPTSVTGFKMLINRDNNGTRMWQWRANGTSMEWVKIVGGVATVAASSVFAINTACIVGVTVSAAGSVKLYKNGVQVGSTGSIAAANYGGTADPIQIAYAAGAGTFNDAYFSESAVFCGQELSAARMLAYATAAGF